MSQGPLTDEQFDQQYTQHSTLCLLLRSNRLSYAVFDEDRQRFTMQQSRYFIAAEQRGALLDEIKSAIAAEDALHLPYRSVKIGLGQSASVLVPAEFWVEEEAGAHLSLQVETDPDDLILADQISDLQTVVEYPLDLKLLEYLQGAFPEASVFHADTALLTGLQAPASAGGRDVVFMHIHQEAFLFVWYQNGQLQFFNRFEFRSREDFIYYVLLVAEELGLDRESARFVFLGEAVEGSAIHQIAQDYLRHVSFGERPANLQYARSIREQPGQFNFNLFALQLCH